MDERKRNELKSEEGKQWRTKFEKGGTTKKKNPVKF